MNISRASRARKQRNAFLIWLKTGNYWRNWLSRPQGNRYTFIIIIVNIGLLHIDAGEGNWKLK